MRVRYARDVCPTNGLPIRIRLVVLSNFHVQSFFHPSYGLFYINFKRFKSFLGLTELIKSKSTYDVSMMQAVKVDR